MNLYAPSRQAGDKKQNRSPFVDRIEAWLETQNPVADLAIRPSKAKVVEVSFEAPLWVSPSQLALYEKCPRRFLYAHVLKLGGCRTESAFMKMHTAVQATVDDMLVHEGGLLSQGDMDVLFGSHWAAHGPTDHNYANSYKRAARRLIAFLVELRAGETSEPKESFVLNVGNMRIIVQPDESTRTGDGRHVLRRIRTGHMTSNSTDTLEAAAYQLVEGTHTEFVFLNDESRTSINMSKRKLNNRKDRINAAGLKIKDGEFPAKPKQPSRTCPQCPYFIICSPPPAGRLTKKSLS